MLHHPANLREPLLALFQCTGDNDAEGLPIKGFHPAQIEDAILPKRFQWIAKYTCFAFRERIGCVEDTCRLGPQQTDRDAFALISIHESVGDTRTKDPVDPALEDGGRLAPPIWMDDDDALRIGYFLAVSSYLRGNGGFFRDLNRGKDRVEFFRVQIVEGDLMPILLQPGNGSLCDGMIEAIRRGVSQDDRDAHVEWPLLSMML